MNPKASGEMPEWFIDKHYYDASCPDLPNSGQLFLTDNGYIFTGEDPIEYEVDEDGFELELYKCSDEVEKRNNIWRMLVNAKRVYDNKVVNEFVFFNFEEVKVFIEKGEWVKR